MQYSLGEGIGDFGFAFFEKIHEPIFLFHRLGRLVRINEAGRKLLKIAHLSSTEIENFFRTKLADPVLFSRHSFLRFQEDGLMYIARNLIGSEFVLVEVKR
jgi:hypothetical protein